MMKTIKKSALYLCVLLIIATGFFMPELVSKGIDYNLHNKSEQMKNRTVSLALPESDENAVNSWMLFNQIISDHYSTIVEIPENLKIYNFSNDKIKEISAEIFRYLGFDENDCEKIEVVPNLFIDNSGNICAVYWRCSCIINKNGMEQVMWIDDVEGKMVGLLLNKYDIYVTKSEMQSDLENDMDESGSDMPNSILMLSRYCEENYHAKKVICRNETNDHYTIEVIINKDGDEIVYSLPVNFEENNYLTFNI